MRDMVHGLLILLAVPRVQSFTFGVRNPMLRVAPLPASRREVLEVGVLALGLGWSSPALAAGGGIGSQPDRGSNLYGSLGKIDEYMGTVNNLRKTVTSAEIELRQKRKEVERVIGRSIEPMIDAMLLNELSFDLSEDDLQRGAALPQLMKGHLAELKAVYKEDTGYEAFVGRNGAKYAGGRVEVEIGEVIDNAREYLTIAKKTIEYDDF